MLLIDLFEAALMLTVTWCAFSFMRKQWRKARVEDAQAEVIDIKRQYASVKSIDPEAVKKQEEEFRKKTDI